MENGKILIIEDDPNIVDLARIHIGDLGIDLDWSEDGESGLRKALQNQYKLIILDLMLPKLDGLEVCKRIRAENKFIPILMLTAKSEELDKVLGLELGADDYLCKPFSTRELLTRVKVLFRRQALTLGDENKAEGTTLRCGSLELDRPRHSVRWNGQKVPLTVTEFRILEALIRQPGFAKTREQLLEEGYPFDEYMSDRNIDGHIKRIRKKISQLDPEFDGIETIYGLGYRYRADSQA